MKRTEDPRGARSGQKVFGGVEDGAVLPLEDLLVPFLLLFLRGGGLYGRRLEERVDGLSLDGLRPGEMYRILWKMEQEGLVLCNREGGEFRLPERRYEVTEAGEAYLEFWADSLVQYEREIDLFFRLYGEVPAQGARIRDASFPALSGKKASEDSG